MEHIGELDFRAILRNEKIERTDGERGIENLNKLAKMLGYNEDGFKYGSSLERFLQDNQGAVEALVDWIEENQHYWVAELEEYMPEDEGDEENDEDDDGLCKGCGGSVDKCICL